MNQSSMPILKVEKLVCEIQGARILNGVSLEIREGETVGMIGPNGSGKTTLFNCLSGFSRHCAGSIHFKGEDISRITASKRSHRGLGRVFQSPGIFREMTVLENMLVAMEGRKRLLKTLFTPKAEARRNRLEALRLLREVGLKMRASVKASSLSGGQMRLLEMARTLAFGADLFMLDEPTAGVSPKMKQEVAKQIMRLQTLGKTVLLIEHDMIFIQRFCTRIIVLDEGRVVLEGSPKEVRENPLLQEIYFGSDGDPSGTNDEGLEKARCETGTEKNTAGAGECPTPEQL